VLWPLNLIPDSQVDQINKLNDILFIRITAAIIGSLVAFSIVYFWACMTYHCFKNSMSIAKKTVWIFFLLMLNVLTSYVYYFLHFKKSS